MGETNRAELRAKYAALVDAAWNLVVKTEAHFRMAMESLVRRFYDGTIDGFGFVDGMVTLITEQYTRAWNEGMREIGLDPKEDLEPEWAQVLDARIQTEVNLIDGIAGDIEAGRQDKEKNPLSKYISRVPMWSNRYNEVRTLAIATCSKEKLIWKLGMAEHCADCLRLEGCVDYADNWQESGWMPQSSRLECGGYRCQCSLTPTRARRTRGGVAARMG